NSHPQNTHERDQREPDTSITEFCVVPERSNVGQMRDGMHHNRPKDSLWQIAKDWHQQKKCEHCRKRRRNGGKLGARTPGVVSTRSIHAPTHNNPARQARYDVGRTNGAEFLIGLDLILVLRRKGSARSKRLSEKHEPDSDCPHEQVCPFICPELSQAQRQPQRRHSRMDSANDFYVVLLEAEQSD